MASTKPFLKSEDSAFEKRSIQDPRGARLLFAVFFIVGTSMFLFINYKEEIHYHSYELLQKHFAMPEEDPRPFKEKSGYLVDTPVCRIPDLHPFDPMIKKYIEDPPPIDCTSERPSNLVESNITSLYLVTSVLPEYNVTEVSQLNCCYRPFWRTTPNLKKRNHHPDLDNSVTYGKKCIPFVESVTIKDEFVAVTCKINNTTVYEDFHAFVVLKEEVEKRCDQALDNHVSPDSNLNISVLMIGVDAVSRLNLHRQMPLTTSFLSKKLNAIEMLGYNKVADNTFPNLMPTLSGLSVDELKQSCWKKDSDVFDKCHWLWEDFAELGFRTAYGEDACWMGMFNYIKNGFYLQPTDYYIRPFIKTSEDKLGHNKPLNANLCVGGRLTFQVLCEYVTKFVLSMFPSRKFFSLFWENSLTHDYLNYPKHADQLYFNLFSTFYNRGVFNNTVLIFFSDHGIRWGDIRSTYQGMLEERLPFLLLAFPDWFRERYSSAVSNLQRNSKRLTTAFDLHETLKDLLNPSSLDSYQGIWSRTEKLSNMRIRGQSLFLPVPINRTCGDAGINSHWCTCQSSEKVNVNNPLVFKTALFLCQKINEHLSKFIQCRTLQLDSIHDARVGSPSNEVSRDSKDKNIYDYTVIFQTIPGNAVFEATARIKAESMELIGTVSRINRYGNQSSCISDYHMKLYCYCG